MDKMSYKVIFYWCIVHYKTSLSLKVFWVQTKKKFTKHKKQIYKINECNIFCGNTILVWKGRCLFHQLSRNSFTLAPGILIFEPCFTFISLLMIFYTASLTPASLNHLLIFSEVKTQPEIATNQAPVTTHHLLEPNVTVDYRGMMGHNYHNKYPNNHQRRETYPFHLS